MGIYVDTYFYKKDKDLVKNNISLLHAYEVTYEYLDQNNINMKDTTIKWEWRSLNMLINTPFLSDYGIYYNPLDYIFYYFAQQQFDTPRSEYTLLFDPECVLSGVNILLEVIKIARDNGEDLNDLDSYDEENQLKQLKINLEQAIQNDLLCNIVMG